MSARRPIAIIGAGSIGLAWSIVFSRAGFPVQLYDPSADQLARAKSAIAERLTRLQHYGLLDEAPDALLARVTLCDSEENAVANAGHIQENAPEDLALKRQLMARLDGLTDPAAAIASSTSTIPASHWASELPGRQRCLNVHPGNPPYLLPVVELIPAPFTEPGVTEAVRDLMIIAGQKPILVAKEVEGFVFNRIQGAVLREAYCLVRDGVASVEDVDTVMREGLGFAGLSWGPSKPSISTPMAASKPTPRASVPPMPAWARSAARTIPGRPISLPRSWRSAAPACRSINGASAAMAR